MKRKVGIIGSGNVGSALKKGLRMQGTMWARTSVSIWYTDRPGTPCGSKGGCVWTTIRCFPKSQPLN